MIVEVVKHPFLPGPEDTALKIMSADSIFFPFLLNFDIMKETGVPVPYSTQHTFTISSRNAQPHKSCQVELSY